jgi:hypothetical protein
MLQAQPVVDDTLVNRPAKGNGAQSDEVTLLALAKLSPVEYDRVRKKEANKLRIKVGTLDEEVKSRRAPKPAATNEGHGQTPLLCDPELWREPVSGAKVLDKLRQAFEHHLTLPEGASTVLALWTVFSHAHDAFSVSPILLITSAEKACGKTTLLMMLGALVRKPLPTANITASSLFRAVEQFSPTLLIDEADTFVKDNEELRGIVNSGWLRAQACVVRCVAAGDDFETRVFSTWSPKALAQIGKPPTTICDRSIEVRMTRQTLQEEKRLEKLRADRLGEFEPIRREVFRFASDSVAALKTADPQMPEGFANRVADNWRPLFAIADMAGEGWETRVRQAAQGLNKHHEDESVGAMLLADLKAIFEGNTGIVPTTRILERLHAMDDRPWPEYGRQNKPITSAGLARILKRFGIKPDRTSAIRGYDAAEFEDSFIRFLPPEGGS